MKTVLVVSSTTTIRETVTGFVETEHLPRFRYIYLVEYFAESLPLPCADLYAVADFANHELLDECIANILVEHTLDEVLSVDEFSVFVAATIRHRAGVPGLAPEQARRFRDKVEMKRVLADHGVRVPQVYEPAQVLAGQTPLPIVMKPRSLAGAVGCEVTSDMSRLAAVAESLTCESAQYVDMSERQVEFEEYIEGVLHHLDGLFVAKQITFLAISRYIGSTLDYLHGRPLASITEEDVDGEWRAFAHRALGALDMPDGAFHLEAFTTTDGDRVFLEVGMRPGGAEVKRTIQAVFGVCLLLDHLRLQLALLPSPEPVVRDGTVGAWLIFPKQHDVSRRTTVARVDLPRHEFRSEPIYIGLPQPGTLASGPFYCHEDNLGAFVFRGRRDCICEDLDWVRAHYAVECEVEAPAVHE